MASEQEINKRLRSLHQDFDFLLDNNVISSELYDELCSRIPRRYNPSLGNANTVALVPVTAPRASSPRASSPQPSVTSLAAQLNNTSLSSTDVTPPPSTHTPLPSYGIAEADVLYDYHSNDEGDLNMTAGQRVIVLEYVNNDWWRGEGPTGQQGIFPSNYVRKIEVPSEKDIKEKAPLPPPAPYAYQQNPPQQYPQPPYAQQPGYQQPQPVAPPEEGKQSKLAKFGKNYGKTFVNATAWGGGFALGADVINSLI